MIYNVRVIPNARKESIEIDGNKIKIKVNAQPEKGKANEAVIELLAKHFGVSKSKVILHRGAVSRDKVIEVLQ